MKLRLDENGLGLCNLEVTKGVAAVAGVERFLDRIDALRDGKTLNVKPEEGRAAVELFATRKIVDAAKEAELRQLIETTTGAGAPVNNRAMRA